MNKNNEVLNFKSLMLPQDVKEKTPTVPRGPEAGVAASPFYLKI